MNYIKVRDHGVYPNSKEDSTFSVYSILKSVVDENETIIEFEEGTYDFYPNLAFEKILYISNHDGDTLKRIAFPIIDKKNITIKGNKTNFIFHTDIIPFYIFNSENIKIQGINIDYSRPVYSEGEILQANEKEITLYIDSEKYPYEVVGKKLYFTGENFRHEFTTFLEMDTKTYGPAYNTRDVFVTSDTNNVYGVIYEELDKNIVKMSLLYNDKVQFLKSHKKGNKLVLRHFPRTHPAFYLKDCKDINLNNIDIYHCSGMGLIAEHTENISLDKFNVKINPDNERIFTATADATHFVYCKGKINIENCLFENQLDDPVNIHGIYAKVKKVLSPKEIILTLVHEQQKGVRIGKCGESLALVDNETMMKYGENTIKNIDMINKETIYIEFETPLDNVEVGHVVENLEYVPDVNIKNCIFRNNRARGLLLTSAGNVVVENNIFNVPGAGVLIEGDANYWFESGATKNIVIKNNIFDNCSYVEAWGKAPIQVTPGVRQSLEKEKYHKNLIIENNVFNCFDERLIYAHNIENIEFKNNTINLTDTYPSLGTEAFVLNNIVNFVNDNNEI